jgi:hypothetical protein
MNLMRQLSNIVPGKRTAAGVFFDFKIGWAATYDNLFRGEWETESDELEVMHRARIRGRVLLCGRGGSGKTTILRRLHQKQLKADELSAFVRVSTLTLSATVDIPTALSDPATALPFLLQHSDYAKSPEHFILSLATKKLLIVDGLNEVPTAMAERLVQACDSIAAVYSGISVIACDRLVRRTLDEKRWALGFVEPLDELVIGRTLRQSTTASDVQISELTHNPIFRLPFFLNKALEDPIAGTGESVVGTYLKLHGGVGADGLTLLQEAAFRLYQENRSRSFPLDGVRKLVGGRLADDLVASGAVETGGSFAQFSHHLIHDYLAADYVAAHENLWGAETLDILSFKGGSFDATAAVLEGLEPSASGRFLRKIYDWNLYATGYALAEVAERQPGKVSPDMAEIVYAMLAEKRFDLFSPTAKRAEDALLLIKTPHARKYAHAQGAEEVYELVRQHHTSGTDFRNWRALFTRTSSTQATDGEVQLLSDADSVMGWTSANVLKRLEMSDSQQLFIREILTTSNSAAARWRAAHVLGSFANDANLDALESRLGDGNEDLWVRYGSLRSLIELAVHADPTFRQAVFERLHLHWSKIQEEPRLTDELLNSLQVRKEMQPGEWAALTLAMLQNALSGGKTEADMERIRRVVVSVNA